MFEILFIGIAIAALILAWTARSRLSDVEARIARLEAGVPPKHAAPAAAPAPSDTLLAPTIAAEATQPEAPLTGIQTPAEQAAEPPPPPPEAPPAAPEARTPPPASPGLEERLGTRWVVWVGGLTLALGGLFLVRYSIEAGLLGPAARVFFGGLFAAALLAAGEWTRRKEQVSPIATLPIANIPAILTAAGTAVAFGTTFA